MYARQQDRAERRSPQPWQPGRPIVRSAHTLRLDSGVRTPIIGDSRNDGIALQTCPSRKPTKTPAVKGRRAAGILRQSDDSRPEDRKSEDRPRSQIDAKSPKHSSRQNRYRKAITPKHCKDPSTVRSGLWPPSPLHTSTHPDCGACAPPSGIAPVHHSDGDVVTKELTEPLMPAFSRLPSNAAKSSEISGNN
jgi:hypothetical protein